MITDDIEGKQHVADPGIGHDFRFAELLHRDPLGAKRHLIFCQRHQLVRLDMRPVAEPELVAAFLPALEIALHHADVDDRHRRFQILDPLGFRLESKIARNILAAHFCPR